MDEFGRDVTALKEHERSIRRFQRLRRREKRQQNPDSPAGEEGFSTDDEDVLITSVDVARQKVCLSLSSDGTSFQHNSPYSLTHLSTVLGISEHRF